MMEVTSHIKSVLKNYQHSATKSLQGPGLTLVQPKNELPSPEIEKEEFVPASFPVQQVPILTTPDTSCSERTETILEGECISCFVVGGEKRLCLPQVLNSVLRDFTLLQINQQCDLLQIYCSRCTPEQLNVLKSHGILPCSAHSCGLITKTDAERLCSALLCGQRSSTILPPKTAVSFTIYHECFGKSGGLCFPELYTSKNAKCIECTNCRGGFTPQQFVCHVHDKPENRTVHWGFDSCNWRCYLHVPKDHIDHKQCEKYLDEMRDQFEGKLPFPPASETAIKRKQMLASDLMKGRDIPLKKQKLDCLSNFNHMFLSSANVETIYLQYFQEYNTTNRHHMSAFKPFKDIQTIKELKTHKANALGINPRYTDPPILQNPERVISVTDTERFERTYQPNVALAPPTPKKHRYGKSTIVKEKKPENISPVQLSELDNPIVSSDVVLRVEDEHFRQASPEKFVDSTTVSVVVPPPSSNKYNPEIELSTDTEDSASETSEKHHSEFGKIEDALKTADVSVRERVLELFRNLSKEQERLLQDNREKDLKISELQQKNTELVIELEKSKELLYQCSNNRTNSQNNSECKKSVHDGSDVDTSSSIIKTKECNGTEHNAIITGGEPQTAQQKSVIASLDDIEQKAIIQTAPE